MNALLTFCLLLLNQQSRAVDDPLQHIESYVSSIKSYNVFFQLMSTNYYKNDEAASKLIKRDTPSTKTEYVRQLLSGSNTSYEQFDDRKKVISKVHSDGKIERGINLDAEQCFIRKPAPIPGYGKDYRETYRQFRAGSPVIEILKRRASLRHVTDSPVDRYHFVSDPPATRTAMSDFIITMRLLPEHSLAIGAMEFTPKKGVKVPIKYSVLNKKFLKLPDGVFVPIESLFSLYTIVDDSNEMKLLANIELVVDVPASQWNKPVNESDYQVIFPKGSKVIDDINKDVRIITEPDTGKK